MCAYESNHIIKDNFCWTAQDLSIDLSTFVLVLIVVTCPPHQPLFSIGMTMDHLSLPLFINFIPFLSFIFHFSHLSSISFLLWFFFLIFMIFFQISIIYWYYLISQLDFPNQTNLIKVDFVQVGLLIKKQQPNLIMFYGNYLMHFIFCLVHLLNL